MRIGDWSCLEYFGPNTNELLASGHPSRRRSHPHAQSQSELCTSTRGRARTHYPASARPSLLTPARRERVLTSVQVVVGSLGLGDVANTRNAIGVPNPACRLEKDPLVGLEAERRLGPPDRHRVSMSLVMPGERRSELDRVRATSPVLARTPVAARNYVNVEKLLEDVVRFHALRDVILLGLDDLDLASVRACKPIRSMPARGSMVHLLTVIRDAEAMARKI